MDTSITNETKTQNKFDNDKKVQRIDRQIDKQIERGREEMTKREYERLRERGRKLTR